MHFFLGILSNFYAASKFCTQYNYYTHDYILYYFKYVLFLRKLLDSWKKSTISKQILHIPPPPTHA